jgi:hypothetical protein
MPERRSRRERQARRRLDGTRDRAVRHRQRPRLLERSLLELAEAQRAAAHRHAEAKARAIQDERLRRLEQDVAELRTRVNGLVFIVIGALITQVVVRMLG